jgi:predicted PurR-regulated permease PerM
MNGTRQLRFWLLGLLLFLVAIYLLRSVLLPFVAGLATAYFLDPVCDRLERLGCSRTAATVIVSICLAVVLAAALILLLPVLERQIADFAANLPTYADLLMGRLLPWLRSLAGKFGFTSLADLGAGAGGQAASIVSWIGGAVGRVLGSGVAIANLLSLLFVTPVVAFYLLRDWDRLEAEIDQLLPLRHAETIRTQLRAIDQTLAGFARGQATVCLLLAAYYGAGLSLSGLNFGLAIGIGIGFMAFIPYVGSIVGFFACVGLALVQFDDWTHVVLVVVLFALGQVLEGYALTPRLVGGRVGLHPVWVIFALLAGGALFGFVGLLLAVPSAAAAGVLIRFAVERYRQSSYFRGDPPWPSSPST